MLWMSSPARGMIPSICLWRWHWGLHLCWGTCPNSQEVGTGDLKAFARLSPESKVTSVAGKSRGKEFPSGQAVGQGQGKELQAGSQREGGGSGVVTCLSAAPVSLGLHRALTQVPGGTRLCCGSRRLRTLLRAEHPKGGTSGCPVSPGRMLPHVVLKEAGVVLQRCHQSSQSESRRSRAESPLGWCEHQLSHTHHTATLAVTSCCL